MNDKQQEKILSVAKHLVTLSLGALGFVITIMFTSAGDEPLMKITEYKNSLHASLIFFFCSIVFGFLVEASVLSMSLGDKHRFVVTKPLFILMLAWISFITASVALIVFALATTYGGAAIHF